MRENGGVKGGFDVPMFGERVTRTYRISRGSAAYYFGFTLVCFGLVAALLMAKLPDDWPPLVRVAAVLFALMLVLLPGVALAWIPYRITLIDDTECEFRALLRRRRVRVHQIRAITWDETDIYIVHDRGKIHMVADPVFEDFLVRLLELNPGIKADEGVRAALNCSPSDTVARGQ